MTKPTPLRIIELRAENFKRLSAVRVRPDAGALTLITGKNAQGKSSVLDAIVAALGGAEHVPGKPIRNGTDKAKIVLDLGAIKVTRRFNAAGSTLVVESVDGSTHRSPQTMLDKLLGTLTFDPLDFARMDDKRQAATLRELAGYDTTQLDAKRKQLFDERTGVNRDVKRLQVQLDGMLDTVAPDQEVSGLELAKEHRAALDLIAANERKRRAIKEAKERVTELTAEVAELRDQLADAEARLENWVKTHAGLVEHAMTDGLADPDVADIERRIADADKVNAAVRARAERKRVAAELKRVGTEADKLTEQIADIDAKKAAALADAHFPVDGLMIEGEAVLFNGVPFKQASSAEQLRVGLAIGAALNPTLRAVTVRDGSLLDEDGIKLVADWAGENDMQVIMERVAGDQPMGIVIEDGEVVSGGVPDMAQVIQ